MNRLLSLDSRPRKNPRATVTRSSNSHTIARPRQFHFAPLHYEPNYSYPLLVWLHGPDNNELEIKQIMPHVSMRNYVGAAPRGTDVSPLDDGSQIQFCWGEDEVSVQLAEERLWECIDGAREQFNIAPGRLFIAGLQSGGTMALRLALRNARHFAGALSFGGAFPSDRAPLSLLHSVRKMPLFFATTAQSTRYPQAKVCEHLRLFHSAGMSVTIRQYPGEDGLTKPMLEEMDRWIMERITKPRPAEVNLIEHHSAN